MTRFGCLLAAGRFVLSGSGGSAQEPTPRGIYVYSYPRFVENGDYERAMAVKGVDGAAVVIKADRRAREAHGAAAGS